MHDDALTLTPAEAAHIEFIRDMCEFVDVPERAVELLERGATRTDVFDILHPYVHGGELPPASLVPFRTLFTGNWALNDPELDWDVL